MPLDTILPLALFVITATISPGGATALATASGAQFGFRRSLPLMTGIVTGLASLAAIAAIGLGSVLTAMPSLQVIMRLAGSTYLLWLAWQVARSGPPRTGGPIGKPTSIFGGACLLWLNPKGWAIALGAAASFATLESSPVRLALLLGGAFAIAAALSLSLWCATGLVLARLLRSAWQWRVVNTVLGLMIVASIVPMWLQ